MRPIALLLFIFFTHTQTIAQIPPSYYDAAEGLTGEPLRAALKSIIDNHNSYPYSGIDNFFQTLDKKSNGKLWDIYSYVFSGAQPYEYTFGTHECDAGLQYNSEGDCFNKEHLWPQSIYNQQSPMRSDLHQLFPTDGWVNNKRSNFPFGDVDAVSYTSANGSKLGTSITYSGYSGKVFEPIDSFKGDVARAIFYMSTRYDGESSSWSDWEMASGDELTADAVDLLLAWHHLDPVSTKEIIRNNYIYNIQNNRNPFVDHPFLADCIWAQSCTPLSTLAISDELEIRQTEGMLLLSREVEHARIVQPLGQVISEYEDIDSIEVRDLGPGIYIIYLEDGQSSSAFKFSVN